MQRSERTESTTGWGWVLLLGLLMVVLGVLLLGLPVFTAVTAAAVAGVFFILLGIGGIVVGARAARPARRWTDILWGVVTLLVGLYCFLFPVDGAISLVFAIAFWMLFRGALEVVAVFRARDSERRALYILSAVLDLVLGALLLANYPFPAVQFVGIALALSFIFAGFSTAIGAFGLRRLQQ